MMLSAAAVETYCQTRWHIAQPRTYLRDASNLQRAKRWALPEVEARLPLQGTAFDTINNKRKAELASSKSERRVGTGVGRPQVPQVDRGWAQEETSTSRHTVQPTKTSKD